MTLRQKIGRYIHAHLPVSRRSFDIMRSEGRFMQQRILNAVLPWRRLKIARLRRMRGISLNVGSGGRGRADWINMDASPHHADLYCCQDLRQPLPLADNSVKRILAEHVIEHLDFRHEVPRTLAEFHRVLEPGGTVRIIVPDCERLMHAYVSKDDAEWRAYGFHSAQRHDDLLTPIEMVNHVFHQYGEHFFGWDFQAMERVLRDAGFGQVVKMSFGRSLDPELAIDQPNHVPYSLYVDAVKTANNAPART
jgi:predicted SAM-dependent methyltransferase